MKSKKLISSVALFGVVSMSLYGCGDDGVKEKTVSVSSLFENSTKAYDNVKSMTMDVMVGVDGKITLSEDTTMSIGLDGDLDLFMEKDKGAYCEGSASFDIFGMENKNDIKVYMENDGESQVVYTYDSDDKNWKKSVESVEDKLGFKADSLSDIGKKDFSALYDKLSVAAETEKFHNEDCYHVSGLVGYEDLNGVFSFYEEAEKEVEGLDGIKVNSDFFFSKDDKRLVGFVLNFANSDFSEIAKGLENSISGLFGSTEEEVEGEVEVEEETEASEEESSFDMHFEQFVVEFGVSGVDNYTYELPSEVTDNLAKGDEESSTEVDSGFLEYNGDISSEVASGVTNEPEEESSPAADFIDSSIEDDDVNSSEVASSVPNEPDKAVSSSSSVVSE